MFKKLSFASIILLVLIGMYFVRPLFAGGAPTLYSSSFNVGETTTLTASFTGTTRCTDSNFPFTPNQLVVNADFLEQKTSSIRFYNSSVEVYANDIIIPGYISQIYDGVLYWKPDAAELTLSRNDMIKIVISGVEITQTDLVGFNYNMNQNNQYSCFGWGYEYDTRAPSDSTYSIGSYYIRFGAPLSITPTVPPVTPTQTPTSTPTQTPTPTASPFDLIGFEDPGAVNIIAAPGTTTFAFTLKSTTATMFSYYGYPTSYGPGISFSPSSGGIAPGSSMNTNLYISPNVPEGTYTGYQRLISGSYYPYSTIPVTVIVRKSTPTPTPTATRTPTPTVVPQLLIDGVTFRATSSSIDITWNTNLPATGTVDYGLRPNVLDKIKLESRGYITSHIVRLDGLKRNTQYYFKVNSVDSYGRSLSTSNMTLRTLK